MLVGQEMDVIRVLPRWVQEYPLIAPSFLVFEATRMGEGMQRAQGDIQDLGDRRTGNPRNQQHLDLVLFSCTTRRIREAA
jgi:hypothetical protein